VREGMKEKGGMGGKRKGRKEKKIEKKKKNGKILNLKISEK
jgi:hypothetical protein